MDRLSRGDIWTAAGGAAYAAKPRPVVILQDDRFDGTDSVTVCPLTSDPTLLPLFRVPIAPAAPNGLRGLSFAMADKIATIPRTRLGKRLGTLERAEMISIDRAVLVFLGLAGGQGRKA